MSDVTFAEVAAGQLSIDALSPDEQQAYFSQQYAANPQGVVTNAPPPVVLPPNIPTIPSPIISPAPSPSPSPAPPLVTPPTIGTPPPPAIPFGGYLIPGPSGAEVYTPPSTAAAAAGIGTPPSPSSIPPSVPPGTFPVPPTIPIFEPPPPVTAPVITPAPAPAPTPSGGAGTKATGGDIVVAARQDLPPIAIHAPGITPATAAAISSGIGAVEANVDSLLATSINHVQSELDPLADRVTSLEGEVASAKTTGAIATNAVQQLESQLGNDEANIRSLNDWVAGEPTRVANDVAPLLTAAIAPLALQIGGIASAEQRDASNIVTIQQEIDSITQDVSGQGEEIATVEEELSGIAPTIEEMKLEIQDNAQCCAANATVLQPIISANIKPDGWSSIAKLIPKVVEILGVLAIGETLFALLDMPEELLAENAAINVVAPIADNAANLAIGYVSQFWGGTAAA